jgi:hypothetical protein
MSRFLLLICFATLLLIAGVASAFEPGARHGGANPYREGAAIAARREAARRGFASPAVRPPEQRAPEAGVGPRGPVTPAERPLERPATPPTSPNAAQRAQHLSPDERRALRQQIDEAGHDIYRAPNPAHP